jgi:hypothetical protein
MHWACARLSQVCDTIVTTVPKSVVHCLVRKAEKNLLNHMFGHVHKLSEVEIERMLQVSIAGRHRCCDGKGTQPLTVPCWMVCWLLAWCRCLAACDSLGALRLRWQHALRVALEAAISCRLRWGLVLC